MSAELRRRVNALQLNKYGVPPTYRGSRFANFETPTEEHAEALAFFRDYLDNLNQYYVSERRDFDLAPVKDPKTIGRGVIIQGPAGSGKTTLGIAFLMESFERFPKVHLRFEAAADYIEAHIEEMKLEQADEYGDDWYDLRARIKAAKEAPILMLDDLGKEHHTKSGFAANVIDSLLRKRHRTSRPTIITTNLTAGDWEKYYGASMPSFINRAFTSLLLPGGGW